MKKPVFRRAAASVLVLFLLTGTMLSGCSAGDDNSGVSKPPVEVTGQTTTNTPTDTPTDVPADTPTDAPADTPADADWAPDIRFTTVDMNGGEWTDACFAGHTLTVVNLWAYWCGPCVGELPDLQKLSEDYADRGVQFLGVYDKEDEAEDINTVNELGVTYPCLRYTADFDPYMDTGYIPVTIFVDGSGKVLGEAHIGSKSYAEWAAVIDGYLA